MAKRIIALFVEGPTEIEFYKALVKHIHEKMGTPFDCTFKWLDMKGIGNYKDKVLRKFNNLRHENPDAEVHAILCIDTDVFDLSPKPPINRKAVKDALMKSGACKVHYIEAKHSIEDWFLLDFEGVRSFLKLPRGTKKPSGKGQDVLRSLFKSAKKVYIKGGKTEGFIAALDITKIISAQCKIIKPLCNAIGADCRIVCGKE